MRCPDCNSQISCGTAKKTNQGDIYRSRYCDECGYRDRQIKKKGKWITKYIFTTEGTGTNITTTVHKVEEVKKK